MDFSFRVVKIWTRFYSSLSTCRKRLSARRKHTLKVRRFVWSLFSSAFVHRQSATSAPQSCMLVVAGTLLDAEAGVKVEEREKYLAEKCPPLELPYSRDELMVSPNKRPVDTNWHKACRNMGVGGGGCPPSRTYSREGRYSVGFKYLDCNTKKGF